MPDVHSKGQITEDGTWILNITGNPVLLICKYIYPLLRLNGRLRFDPEHPTTSFYLFFGGGWVSLFIFCVGFFSLSFQNNFLPLIGGYSFTVLWWFLPYWALNQTEVHMCCVLSPAPPPIPALWSSRYNSWELPVSCIELDWDISYDSPYTGFNAIL